MVRKKIIFAVIFLFSAALACGCLKEKKSFALVSGELSDSFGWDFGVIKEGSVAKHKFVYKNKTERILTITGVTTSCGCATSEIKNKTLKPQETTEIEVQFNSKGYSGSVTQFVYVNTDDPKMPSEMFTITAFVQK